MPQERRVFFVGEPVVVYLSCEHAEQTARYFHISISESDQVKNYTGTHMRAKQMSASNGPAMNPTSRSPAMTIPSFVKLGTGDSTLEAEAQDVDSDPERGQSDLLAMPTSSRPLGARGRYTPPRISITRSTYCTAPYRSQTQMTHARKKYALGRFDEWLLEARGSCRRGSVLGY